MKREILTGIIVLFAIGGLVTAEDLQYRPGVLLVKFADVNGVTPSKATKNSILNSLLGCSCSPVAQEYSIVRGLTLIQLPAGMSVENARVTLRSSPSIIYAEPDYRREISRVPNDAMFPQLWAMRNTGQTGGVFDADIDATEAWDIATGSKSIVVAVTDTGVDYNHPDLAANMWVNPGEIPGNGIDDDGNGYIDDVYGWDSAGADWMTINDGDGDPMPSATSSGHGTHVSGTIGAVGNNGLGVTGVCWNVSIMAVKIFADNAGFTFDTDEIAGIQYAINNGARVINASWGGPGYSQALYDAIAAARDAGVLFVAAAGNESSNNDLIPSYPDGYDLDNIIAVLATNDEDNLTYYSNWGATSVDIGAPGGEQYYPSDPRGILSTLPGNQYDFYQGTSMASPHVAGAAALVLSVDPNLKYADVKDILLLMADPDLDLEGLCVSEGRLNLYKAVLEAAGDTLPPMPDPAEWQARPKATGLHTIAMEAVKATDRSGVEYYFECVTDANKNSIWQSTALYVVTGLAPGGTYGFRVKARDLSPRLNETGWSAIGYATTASTIDNLSPAPDPAGWYIKPKVNRLLPVPTVRMRAKLATDESSPVQYFFRCTDILPPGQDLNIFNSGWQSIDTYTISSGLTLDSTYTFTVKAKDALGNETAESEQASVTIAGGPRVLSVPVPYPTIQDAIFAANNGDIVEISPGAYMGGGNFNINFLGKAIIVRSLDPENPDVVAATIIDCNNPGIPIEWVNWAKRGFIFNSGEGADSILAGVTIRNGYVKGAPYPDSSYPTGSVVGPGEDGLKGRAGVGGAILIGADPSWGGTSSSPTIRNCIITNCVVIAGQGSRGGDGADGTDSDPGDPGATPPVDPTFPTPGQDGGFGGDSGDAFGGGIYSGPGSGPTIQNCTITSCRVLREPGDANDGGDGGDGGQSPAGQLPGGNGGLPGFIWGDIEGGGIYIDKNNAALLINCTIEDCNAFKVYDGSGIGHGGEGGSGTPPGIDLSYVLSDWFFSLSGYGGGAFCSMGTVPVGISATTFTGNRAGVSGGGICYRQGTGTAPLTLADCNVTGNSVIQTPGSPVLSPILSGGGLDAGDIYYSNSAVIQIYNSSFTDNNANEGGGVYLNNADLTVSGSTFANNQSFEGGAINGFNCAVEIVDSNITNNTATGPDGIGAGLALWNSYGEVTNCIMKANSADAYGGGVFMDGWNNSPLEFTSCLFANNTANLEGGGLSCNIGAWARLTNCTFAGNSVIDQYYGSGGAVSCAEYFAWVEIINSILWNNTAGNGPQIAVGTVYGSDPEGLFADVDVDHSDVQGGEAGVYLEDPDYTAVWWWSGNLDTDPLFATADINEVGYYLIQTAANQLVDSPCVDAGDSDASGLASQVGHLVTTRTDHISDAGIVDMGYHYDANIAATEYWLTIEVVNNVGGRLKAEAFGDSAFIVWDPNTFLVKAGAVVRLDAIADMGYGVLKWTGTDDDATTTANNTVTMTSDRMVQVEFVQYVLTIEVVDSVFPRVGTLFARSDGNDPFEISARETPASRAVIPGTVVDIEAVPDEGFEVWRWIGTDDDASTALTNTITMNGPRTVGVVFEPNGMFFLTTRVTGNGTVAVNGNVMPNPGRTLVRPYSVVQLLASPDNPSDAIIWQGTDDDYAHTPTNTVFVTGHTDVNVMFYSPRVLYVGADGDYQTIQEAINVANDMDIVMVMPGTYDITESSQGSGRITLIGKAITLTSVNPADPSATVIIGGLTILNVGRDTVIDGFTIGDIIWGGMDGCNGQDVECGNEFLDGQNGYPYYGAGMCLHTFYWVINDVNATDPTPFPPMSGSPIVRNCVFHNCVALGGSGGTGGQGGDGGWGAWARGGAVSVGPDSNPLFEHCTFIDNEAVGGDGGNGAGTGGRGGSWDWAIANRLTGWTWAPPGGYLEYWRYSGYGGAVYCDTNSRPEFIDCEFTGNTAYGGDCGISAPPYIPTQHWQIDRFGAAVYAGANSAPKFIDCDFSDNEANLAGLPWHTNRWQPRDDAAPDVGPKAYDNLAHGGGVAFEKSANPLFANCTFNGNRAHVGGGMWWDESYPQISDSNFIDNTANHGGGILFVGGTTKIEGSIFTGNQATLLGGQGGAIASLGADTEIIDCNISGNQTVGLGGGIYISSKDIDGNEVSGHNTVLVKNCLITRNSAGQGGGGISANWYADPNIVNCTIVDNNVMGGFGGGLYSTYTNYTRLTNSILWGNIAISGGQIAIGTQVHPSTVDVRYSDVEGGQVGVAIEPGCTLNWVAGNISSDPLFTPAGRYYLSQVAAGQSQNSRCVDAGSDYASRFGLHQYTTRTDAITDRGIVDMGYHYRVPEVCLLSDLSGDGSINFEDFAVFALRWLNEGCSDVNGWCEGSDLTFDTIVNYYDLKDFALCWLFGVVGPDVTPPTPNPMQWATPPYAASATSAAMLAAVATDDSGGIVEYDFEETTGSPGSTDSGWQSSPLYVDQGLTTGDDYCYRVRARDPSGNMTDWSDVVCVNSIGDTNAPTPAPTILFIVDQNTVSRDINTASGQYQVGMDWWHKVVTDVSAVTDDSGGPILIRFVCLDDDSLNSPFVDMLMTVAIVDPSPTPKWRVTNDGGNLVYDVNVNWYGLIGRTLRWKVCAYDVADNEACSAVHTIGPPPL